MARTVVKDRKEYRIWNVVDKVWHRLNFLTNANSVDASDGKTLQTKVGAIDGITSDVNGESERIAASIKCVNRLNNSLVSNIYVGSDGKLHKVIGGADTVLPFNSLKNLSLSSTFKGKTGITITKEGLYCVLLRFAGDHGNPTTISLNGKSVPIMSNVDPTGGIYYASVIMYLYSGDVISGIKASANSNNISVALYE